MSNIETTEVKIEGMYCVSCERTIAGALKKVPGVVDVNVSFVSGESFERGLIMTNRVTL